MDKLRLRFWKFVHESLEKTWHWVYYHKVKPLTPTWSPSTTYGHKYYLLRSSEPDPETGTVVQIWKSHL